jgi:hypothetical protein
LCCYINQHSSCITSIQYQCTNAVWIHSGNQSVQYGHSFFSSRSMLINPSFSANFLVRFCCRMSTNISKLVQMGFGSIGSPMLPTFLLSFCSIVFPVSYHNLCNQCHVVMGLYFSNLSWWNSSLVLCGTLSLSISIVVCSGVYPYCC